MEVQSDGRNQRERSTSWANELGGMKDSEGTKRQLGKKWRSTLSQARNTPAMRICYLLVVSSALRSNTVTKLKNKSDRNITETLCHYKTRHRPHLQEKFNYFDTKLLSSFLSYLMPNPPNPYSWDERKAGINSLRSADYGCRHLTFRKANNKLSTFYEHFIAVIKSLVDFMKSLRIKTLLGERWDSSKIPE
ncbi:hypothetical protein KIL84_006499 [Mauremys mutica]|uniref:Uncharacterized protein n=1 Tax=Mauremys mutica TaxID=74926 RepID=A0A9D4AW41_9SAUR|nr:hypothetical protein KIL84_006499 [Mauremys mutica]